MEKMRHLTKRFVWQLAAVSAFVTVAGPAQLASAQQADHPVIEIHGNTASERSVDVEAKGDHDVQSSATLRARGCVGFVADAPSLRLVFHDEDSSAAPIVRATGDVDLVLLVGSANQGWYCNDNTYGTDPEIRLPAGSRTYSVWVGTRSEPMTTTATVSIRVDQSDSASTAGGACGESNARVPQGVSSSEWSRYGCEASTDVGPRWNLCLPRAAYSDNSDNGCPGAERCCPPAGFEPSVSQDMQAPEGSTSGPVSGMCGEAGARRPEGVTVTDWNRYSCESPGDAGSRWTLCLARAAYSDMDGDGCPGLERCCPPAGFQPGGSSSSTGGANTDSARAERQSSDSGSSVTTPPRDPADPPPLRRAPETAEPSGATTGTPSRVTTPRSTSTPTSTSPTRSGSSAATSGNATPSDATSARGSAGFPDPSNWDEDVLVDQSPVAFIRGATSVIWRGFATTVPAREQPRTVSPIAFDFPVRPSTRIENDRQWLVIDEPRELLSRHALTLTDRVSGETLSLGLGARIELLGAVNSDYCIVNYEARRREVLCPSRSDFRGANGPFEGLSAESFHWFLQVQSASGQHGWIEVHLDSPLFDVTVE